MFCAGMFVEREKVVSTPKNLYILDVEDNLLKRNPNYTNIILYFLMYG